MRIVNNAIVFQPAIAEDSGSYSCMRPDTLESIRAQLYVNGDGKFQCACSFWHIVLFCCFVGVFWMACCCFVVVVVVQGVGVGGESFLCFTERRMIN